MSQQRLSNLDTMLLRMDNPADPVVVTGMLVLGSPIAMEQLKATIQTRLLRFDRFQQRVIPSRLSWRTPYWKDDPLLISTTTYGESPCRRQVIRLPCSGPSVS